MPAFCKRSSFCPKRAVPTRTEFWCSEAPVTTPFSLAVRLQHNFWQATIRVAYRAIKNPSTTLTKWVVLWSKNSVPGGTATLTKFPFLTAETLHVCAQAISDTEATMTTEEVIGLRQVKTRFA